MYEEIAARFARDIGPHKLGPDRHLGRPHEMTTLHDDGLYRHLRFRSPDHSTYWFDLITVPGVLIFRGDGESFVFARTEDMFAFFRRHTWRGNINPTYWSEKLTSDRNGVMRYSPELFTRTVKEHAAEAIRYGDAPRGLGKAVADMLRDGNTEWEEGARAELDDFKHKGFRFHDTWEWSFRDFDWWFLWACQAIVWGIARYDEAKAAAGAEAVTV